MKAIQAIKATIVVYILRDRGKIIIIFLLFIRDDITKKGVESACRKNLFIDI